MDKETRPKINALEAFNEGLKERAYRNALITGINWISLGTVVLSQPRSPHTEVLAGVNFLLVGFSLVDSFLTGKEKIQKETKKINSG